MTCTSRPTHSSVTMAAARSVSVLAATQRRPSACGGDHDGALGVAAPIVHHRVTVDARGAVVIGREVEDGGARPRLVGDVDEAEAIVGWRGRPERHAVLRHHPAHARDEPGCPGLLAEHLHHLGECLEVVVVERAARERHAAGDGERPVALEPQLVGLQLYRGREAAVEVEVVGVARVERRDIAASCSAPTRDRGERCSSPALRERHHRVRLDRAEREHPRVARHAVTRCRFHRAHDERRRLVDVPLRAVPPRIRRAVHRVLGPTAPTGTTGAIGVRRHASGFAAAMSLALAHSAASSRDARRPSRPVPRATRSRSPRTARRAS